MKHSMLLGHQAPHQPQPHSNPHAQVNSKVRHHLELLLLVVLILNKGRLIKKSIWPTSHNVPLSYLLLFLGFRLLITVSFKLRHNTLLLLFDFRVKITVIMV
jgi:hypothetical protein